MSMCLEFDKRLMRQYENSSQKVRVLSEGWVKEEAYCPNCGNTCLEQYSNNKPVADFFCEKCNEDFELKSKKYAIGLKIVDGAYKSMLARLADIKNPNLFLLNYEPKTYQVLNFLVIPKHFFVPNIIEKRAPLSEEAIRARWVGCNILLDRIPLSGRVFLIKNKLIEPKAKVLAAWQKTIFLRGEKDVKAKGWLLDIMRCIESLERKQFSLKEIYQFEQVLSRQHPENRHIKDKIRQQLQVLRDKRYLQFIDRGIYQVVK
jgi:type II restriction enzyme